MERHRVKGLASSNYVGSGQSGVNVRLAGSTPTVERDAAPSHGRHMASPIEMPDLSVEI